MWLPEDERRLLVGYVKRIGKIAEEEWFDKKQDLAPLLKLRDQPEDLGKLMRIDEANNVLVNRGLITTQLDDLTKKQVAVALTTEGYNLGKRYQTFLGRADTYYLEYKAGLLGVFIGWVLGVLSKVLLDYLT